MTVVLDNISVPMKVVLAHGRGAQVEREEIGQRGLSHQPGIEAFRVLCLHEGRAIWHRPTGQSAAHPLLGHRAKSEIGGRAVVPVPLDPRASGQPLVTGHVIPAVAIKILSALAVCPCRQRQPRVRACGAACEGGEILPISRCRIGEDLSLELVAGALRD